MKKLIVLALVAVLSLPALALAANDVTFPQISYIALDDGSTYTVDTSNTYDSFTVNATTIEFTLSASSVVTLTSLGRKDFTYSGTNGTYMTISETCANDRSSLLITVSPSAVDTFTVTVTPSGSCSGGGGGGAPAAPGGGGGGGGASPAPAASTAESGTANALGVLDNLASDGTNVTVAQAVLASIVAGDGGSAALADNSVAVSLPAAGISANATLSVAPQANFPQPSAGYSAVGSQVYNVTLSGGATIASGKNATLTFKYTDAQISNANEATLMVSYWDETAGNWVEVPSSVNAANNTVTATVSHFTKFMLQAKSNTVPVGSLIKVANKTAVYYLGHDGKRYVFPDDKVFNSWYANFNDVVTITAEQMAAYSLGGNVSVRSGAKLVQFVNYDVDGKMMVDDPKVYAVEPGGVLRWIKTGEIAQTLYGSTWEQRIVPIHSVMFGNYTAGAAIESAVYPSGSVVRETGTNNLYYISGATKKSVSSAAKVANKFWDANIPTASSLSSYTIGSGITDYQNSLSWTAGK
ncbi:MAG: hypothetical protein Q8P32_02610 [Candidatus Komeilibacteria bacterium]|nr:hypothetical protein [Candidatus Komeilibacteria bacterium]